MNTFPILDAPYTAANDELGRFIMDVFGHIEPHIDETDSWIAMPLRLTHNQASDWTIEIGPYALNHNDINKLRQAIHAYDQAAGNAPLRQA